MGQRKAPPKAEKRPKTGKFDIKPRFSFNLKNFPWSSILGVVLVAAIVGTGILLGQHYQSGVTIQGVAVSGNYFTNEAQILQKASIQSGLPADSLRLLTVIENVESLPYVQMASARITHNGRVHIQIRERQPIGMFIHNNARTYADEKGVLLPIIPGRSADVPLVYGVSWSPRQDTLRSDAFLKIKDFLMEVQKDPIAFATISEIAWSPDEGIVALSNENGIRLVFGHTRFNEAIQNWNLFYRQVVAVRGPGNFSAIDLRYDGQIVTRESS